MQQKLNLIVYFYSCFPFVLIIFLNLLNIHFFLYIPIASGVELWDFIQNFANLQYLALKYNKTQ